MKPVDIEFTIKVNADHVPVLAAIQGERERQDKKWGPQNHEYPMWLPILAEEMGEAAKEFLKATFPAVEAEGARREGKPVDTITVEERRRRFRKELIEAAAVLVAMIECGDRNQWFQKERRVGAGGDRRVAPSPGSVGRRHGFRSRTPERRGLDSGRRIRARGRRDGDQR